MPHGASISVERQSSASPPVGGAIGVRIGDNGAYTRVSAGVEADTLASTLEALSSSVGVVEVTRDGDCRGYEWTVEHTSMAGDHVDLMEYNSVLTGTNAEVTVEVMQDGGVHWDPIPGDAVRTHHDAPQVTHELKRPVVSSRSSHTCSTFDLSHLLRHAATH